MVNMIEIWVPEKAQWSLENTSKRIYNRGLWILFWRHLTPNIGCYNRYCSHYEVVGVPQNYIYQYDI